MGKPKVTIKTDEATRKAINSLMDAMVQDALRNPIVYDSRVPGKTVGFGCAPWDMPKWSDIK